MNRMSAFAAQEPDSLGLSSPSSERLLFNFDFLGERLVQTFSTDR